MSLKIRVPRHNPQSVLWFARQYSPAGSEPLGADFFNTGLLIERCLNRGGTVEVRS